MLALLLAGNRALVARETRDGDQLHLREDGSPDKPPLVLVHGYSGSMRWFDGLVPLLESDYRILRVDLLGHGESAKPPSGYAITAQARHVIETLDRAGVNGATFVGHSMGAAVCTAVAEARPGLVERLVLLDEGPDNSFGAMPLLVRLGFVPVLGELMHRLSADPLVRDGYGDAFAKDFDIPEHVVRDFRDMTYTSYKASAGEEDAYLAEERLDERLRRLGIPLAAAFGEEDRFFRADECAEAFRKVPGARVEVIAGVGHSPNVERPEEVARLVRELAL